MEAVSVRRPDGVAILSIWYWVLAGGFGLGACATLVPVGLLSLTPHVSVWSRFTASVLLGLGLSITLLLALACALVAWGLWNLAPWSRVASIVLALLHLPFFPVGTAIGAATLWYMTSHPEALQAFRRA